MIETAQTILVIKLDGIGDFILLSPFLRELRHNALKARVDIVVSPLVYPYAISCPYVDNAFGFRCHSSTRVDPDSVVEECKEFSTQQLKCRYDIAFVPRWDTDFYGATYLAKLSGAKRRVSYSEHVTSEKRCRNRGYDDLLTDVLNERLPLHEVDRNLRLLTFTRGTVYSAATELWQMRQGTCATHRINSNGPTIGIGIGASQHHKRWPTSCFIEFIDMNQRTNATHFLLGDSTERTLGDVIERGVKHPASVRNLVGQLTLPQLVELIPDFDIVITNDSCISHIADAARVPVIVLSPHPEACNPLTVATRERFGPRQAQHKYLTPEQNLPPCKGPCTASVSHCILLIKPASVYEALDELRNETSITRFRG